MQQVFRYGTRLLSIGLLSALLLLQGCSVPNEHQLKFQLDEVDNHGYRLLTEFQLGNWDEICILPPMVGKVYDSPNNKLINDALTYEAVQISPKHWLWVLRYGESVSVVSMPRSRDYDIYVSSLTKDINRSLRAIQLVPKTCVNFKQAGIFRFRQNHRVYFLLGEKHPPNSIPQ